MKEHKVTLIHVLNTLLYFCVVGFILLIALFSIGPNFALFSDPSNCERLHSNYNDWDAYMVYGLLTIYVLWILLVSLVSIKNKAQGKKQPINLLLVSIVVSVGLLLWGWFIPNSFDWVFPLIGRCAG